MPSIARCKGRTGTSGRPVQPCIQCDRRSYAPTSPDTSWVAPAAQLTDSTWHCANRVEFLAGMPRDSGFGELAGE